MFLDQDVQQTRVPIPGIDGPQIFYRPILLIRLPTRNLIYQQCDFGEQVLLAIENGR